MRSIQVPARYRRPAAAAVIGVVVVALVAGSLAWPRTGPTTAAGSASPSGTPGSSPLPSPIIRPPTGVFAAVADLTAVDAAGPVVALDARFRLASLGSTPAAELASRLTVEPQLDLAVQPDPDGRSVELTPRDPLVPGAVYRFSLHGPSDEELDSWAFQAKQPLRVVGTLPANATTDVPTDTGIEITFDQDGVTDAASHVSISPATKGRFEQHGRVLVFVPDALKATTLYTVTVSRGVTVKATGESLAADVRFQFETAGTGRADDVTTFQFPDIVLESATGTAPVIGVWGFGDDERMPAALRLDVYRLSGLDSAVSAYRQLAAFPRWSRWAANGLVATADLPRVLSIDAKYNRYANSQWVGLPNALPGGWYLLELATGTRPAQAILQVTDVSGYLAVSETRTLVWANDLATGGPITGATVATSSGDLGRTDARGLLVADTPAGLRPDGEAPCTEPCAPVVTVTTGDGRTAFLPGSSQQDVYEGLVDSSWWWSDGNPGYWALLGTDRTLYRPTDTINVWGVVRDRDSGKVPAGVKLDLDPPATDDAAQPSITGLTIEPGPTGAFTASIPLADLPAGAYSLRLVVGGTVVQTVELQVAPIVKPAYQLDVETGRRIYIAGDQIRVTVRATFFEGTPVPGVPLRLDGAVERTLATDESGTAIHRMVASIEDGTTSGPNYQSVGVSPARAEEGEIASMSRDFLVFPSSRTVDAESEIVDGRVRVKGSVHVVDVDRLEREVAAGASIWDLDPRGKAVASTNVIARFVELIPTRTRTGTEYDFIEKKAVPVYQNDIRESDAGTVRVKTNAKGDYAMSIPASTSGHDYRVELTISDPDGHQATADAYASAASRTVYEIERGGLALTDRHSDFDGFGIGDTIDLTMSEPGADPAATHPGQYLFFTAQRGLRDATIQSSARFVTTFEPWAAPNMVIAAVRFTGTTYVAGGRFSADFREGDRRLDVGLSVDAPRYAPGGVVNVAVTTHDAKGAPVAATVFLRAVDEKLFTIGGAEEVDPLDRLYASVPSGILSTYQSHRPPMNMFEGGDTTGGGGDERSDFRDTVLFKAIETGADGRGSVSFTLSDDLTSWRVSAAAITAGLDAGKGSIQVPVGLPFFVDASIAPEYLVADRPTIQVRAFGSALKTGSAVTLTVTSKSLKFASAPIRTTAFATVGVPLPALTAGIHDLTISATSGSGGSTMTDRLTRQFAVVESRLARTQTAYVDLGPDVRLDGGARWTTIVLSDAGVGRHLPLLLELAEGGGARLDRALAADLAASILTTRFGSSAGSGPVDAFDADRYRTADGGLALLPYGSSDLELTALVALVAPKHDAASRLDSYLTAIRFDPAETRERRTFALAGLAGLGAPVLPEIQAAAADPELTIREQLMVGIGAIALGDASTARSIASTLTQTYGESLGEQARLRVGTSAGDVTEATALMAVLAAAIGDPSAPAYWGYVEGNASVDALHVLHAVAYVGRTIDRIAVEPASFAYTLDGARRVVELEKGQSFALTVTAAQRATLKLELLSGDVGVTTTWREPVVATAFERDPDVVIRRSVSPSGVIGTDDLVQIDLTVTFGRQAPKGCYQVTDLAPSGLMPIGSLAAWIDSDSGGPALPAGVTLPYAMTGQRVSFCAEPPSLAASTTGSVALRYYARVVTPGTYVWEPAIVESKTGPNWAAHTPQVEVSIR